MATKYKETQFRYNAYGQRLEYIEFTATDLQSLNNKIQNNTNNITDNDNDITNINTSLNNKINKGGAATDINTNPTLVDKNKITP